MQNESLDDFACWALRKLSPPYSSLDGMILEYAGQNLFKVKFFVDNHVHHLDVEPVFPGVPPVQWTAKLYVSTGYQVETVASATGTPKFVRNLQKAYWNQSQIEKVEISVGTRGSAWNDEGTVSYTTSSGMRVKGTKSSAGRVTGVAELTMSEGTKYVGFFTTTLVYGSIILKSGQRFWDCEFTEYKAVRGKTTLSGLDGYFYEGEFNENLPHGKGSVKKTSDRSLLYSGVWSAGHLVERTCHSGHCKGKFDVSGAPLGFMRIFNSNGQEIFYGKVDSNFNPVGSSFSKPKESRSPTAAKPEEKLEFEADSRYGAYSKVTRRFGSLHCDADRWSYVGGLGEGNKRSGNGVEAQNDFLFVGKWSSDARDGLGRLHWPPRETNGLITFREYKSGQVISEREVDLSKIDTLQWSESLRILAINVIPMDWFETSIVELSKKCAITAEERKFMGDAFSVIAETLQKCPGLSIAEIVKAGSAGKDTRITDDSDLDVVVILNEFRESSYDKYAELAEAALKSIGSKFRRTRFALQFFVGDTELEVDLLFGAKKPVTDLVKVTAIGIAEDYGSASRSRLQVEFVAKCEPLCKDLIRLTKYWRSELPWPNGQQFYPKSCMIELICIHVFNSHKGSDAKSGKLYDLFCEVMEKLAVFEALRITFFDQYYPRSAVPAVVLAQMPLILDVAYPANNLAQGFEYGLLKIYSTLTLAILQSNEHPKN